jgi:hypothetical protein
MIYKNIKKFYVKLPNNNIIENARRQFFLKNKIKKSPVAAS